MDAGVGLGQVLSLIVDVRVVDVEVGRQIGQGDPALGNVELVVNLSIKYIKSIKNSNLAFNLNQDLPFQLLVRHVDFAICRVENLEPARVDELVHDLDAVALGQLLDGAAELGALQVRGQLLDLIPILSHFVKDKVKLNF